MTRLVCLLPARNAAKDLPGHLESANEFCDAIVALDDGSTDNTAGILSASPLVKRLLHNPIREDFRGWDDSRNRNMLLEAAAEFEPDWIISVDADERVHSSDAVALRRFLDTDALPGCAYRLQWLQMREDLDHYFPEIIWIPRLFAFEPGQRFPSERLHFAPIPTSIPRSAYVKTTLRIQHLGAMTAELRQMRFEKYRQADPESAYWADYSVILADSKSGILPFGPRDPDLPVLLLEADGTESISTIQRSLKSIKAKERLAIVAGKQLHQLEEHLNKATSEFVLLAGHDIQLSQSAIETIVSAHQAGHAVVAPVVRAFPLNRAEKAGYLLNYYLQLPGSGPANLLSYPPVFSYSTGELKALNDSMNKSGGLQRSANSIGPLFEDAGYICRREPDAQVTLAAGEKRLIRVGIEQFRHGRTHTRRFIERERSRGRLFSIQALRRIAVVEPSERMGSIRMSSTNADPQLSNWFNDSKQHVKIGLGFRTLGSLFEFVRPERGKLSLLVGRPTGFVLIVLRGQYESNALFVRYDICGPYARGVWFDASTLEKLGDSMLDRPLEVFAAREFAATYCRAPVDGIVEIDARGRSPFHAGMAVIRRLIGDDQFDQIDQSPGVERRPRSLRSTVAARDLALLWWSLAIMPRRAIAVIDYPKGDDALDVIAQHLDHGGDTTSKWQAGPRQKRAM
jgi:glycosyltransferase involved in cell wall biosynthesis